jgi:hypothetical protein
LVRPPAVVPDDFLPDVAALRPLLDSLEGVQLTGTLFELPSEPPAEVLAEIMVYAHAHPLCGHFGERRTLDRLSTFIRWPGALASVRRWVAACPHCQRERASPDLPSKLLTTAAEFPLQKVQFDFIGPLRETSRGNKFLGVIVDRYSRWTMARPCATADAKAACATMWQWICHLGIPAQVVTDGAAYFSGEMFSEFLRLLATLHHVTMAGHPGSHGVVERMNAVLEHVLRALLLECNYSGEWDELVEPACFAVNTSLSRVTGTTPWNIIHGFSPRLPLDMAVGAVHHTDEEPLGFARHLAAVYGQMVAQVGQAEAEAYRRTCDQFLKKRGRRATYAPGDYVLVLYGREDKLGSDWRGPYLVRAVDPAGVAVTVRSLLDGAETPVHPARLRRFLPGSLREADLKALAAPAGEFLVQEVLAHRVGADGRLEFLIRWAGFGPDEDSWVTEDDARGTEQVTEYKRAHGLMRSRRR